jgi:hypothetical protein
VEKNGKYGFINGKGDVVVKVEHDIEYDIDIEALYGPTIYNADNDYYDGYILVDDKKDSQSKVSIEHSYQRGDIVFPESFKDEDGNTYIIVGTNSWVFKDNDQITSVKLPETMEFISEGAFSSCMNLTSINIPQSVKSIGNLAFVNCESLQKVTMNVNGQLEKIMAYSFAGCSSLKKIDLPESVTYIGPAAFLNCKNLESITIPNDVEYVYDNAFEGCNKLKINGINKEEWLKQNQAKIVAAK